MVAGYSMPLGPRPQRPVARALRDADHASEVSACDIVGVSTRCQLTLCGLLACSGLPFHSTEQRPPSIPLPFNIRKLLSGLIVEWERLELKRGWNPLSVLHTLCAFANDFHNLGGGFVLIGVAESPGESKPMVAGLSPFELDTIQKEILQLGRL
jgi:hypothetical protein